ncbi:MAG: EamA family transporter RarD [Deltaproteobacteria bacterium]|nr:EamA family transporter RarD [Deltaproteobacteria bacterium]
MSSPPPQDRSGPLYALGAYALWGFFPLYWAMLKAASAPEVLGHRIAGTFALLLVWMAATRRWTLLLGLDRRRLGLLAGASALVTLNWLTYIWGVQNGHVVETSLGYFINPLVNVGLGVWLLGERMRRPQLVAIGLAAVAVLILTVDYGRVPWIAFTLALTFAFYGLLKKKAGVPSVPALFVETAFVAPLAVAYLVSLRLEGTDTLLRLGATHDLLLLGAGVATAIPLLLFGAAANRVALSTLGVLQYLAPSIQFVCGVAFLGEEMPPTRWAGFAFVWVALMVFSWDALRTARRQRRAEP